MKAIAELTPEEARQESLSYKKTYLSHVAGTFAFAIAAMICAQFAENGLLLGFLSGAIAGSLYGSVKDLTVESEVYTDMLDHISGLKQITHGDERLND